MTSAVGKRTLTAQLDDLAPARRTQGTVPAIDTSESTLFVHDVDHPSRREIDIDGDQEIQTGIIIAPDPDGKRDTADEKIDKEAQRVAKSAAGNAETNATKKYRFEASERPSVERMARDAAMGAAENAYKEAIAAGESPAQANKAANKAAKVVAAKIAEDEAKRAAANAAHLATSQGAVFDVAKLGTDAQHQIGEFRIGKTGNEAKRLARELDGLSAAEFLAKMDREPCTMKTANIPGPPPQPMRVYEYPDGTVVRYKPLGDGYRPGPGYSIEVKKNPSLPDSKPEDAAFKVDSVGTAIPRGPYEIKNPYPSGGVQAREFESTIMNVGHKTLRQ